MTKPEPDNYYNKLYKPIEDSNGKILEIGCGYAHFSDFIWNKQRFIISTDIDRSRLITAKQLYPNLNLCQINGEQLPFADNSFDVVISIETFEHISDIKNHLLEVRRILTDEGIYLLKTPNLLWDTPYWMIVHKSSYKQLKKPGAHISTQTYFGLKRILTQCGYRVTFLSFNQICEYRKKTIMSSIFWYIFERILGWLPFFLRPPLFCMGKKERKIL